MTTVTIEFEDKEKLFDMIYTIEMMMEDTMVPREMLRLYEALVKAEEELTIDEVIDHFDIPDNPLRENIFKKFSDDEENR